MRAIRRFGAVCATALIAACASDRTATPVAAGTPALRVESVTQAPANPFATAETSDLRLGDHPLVLEDGKAEEPTILDAPAPVSTSAAPAPASVAASLAPEAGVDRVTDLRTRSLDGYLRALSDTSCPPGTKTETGEPAEVFAKPLPLQPLNPSRTKIGELTFAAGFQLTSPNKRFGGLSGIDILDNGNLLAVSDQGDFVWIDLAKDGLTPTTARISTMRNEKGDLLRGKADGDSEGVAINGGMALVSFERNHRVLAFDLGKCGAAARGAPIVSSPFGLSLLEAFEEAGIAVSLNEGAEPLAVTRDWYLFTGIETKVGNLSPLSARPIEAAPDFDLRVGVGAPEFVGLDVIPSTKGGGAVRAFSLHRSFSALAGNAITVTETDFHRYLDQSQLPRRIIGEIDERSHYRFEETGWRELAKLNLFLTIDNFEGIAAKELPDGRVRLYVISDDNFSASQRTLLMVFDVAKE
jgi:hypothetical protein